MDPLQRPRTTEPTATVRAFTGRRLSRDDNDGHDADIPFPSSQSSQSSATMSMSQPSPVLPESPPNGFSQLQSVSQLQHLQRQVYRPPHQRGTPTGISSFPLIRAPGHLPPPPTPSGLYARHRPPALKLGIGRSLPGHTDLNGPSTAPVSRIAGKAASRGISIDTALRRGRERHSSSPSLPTPNTASTVTPGLSRRRGITMAVLVKDELVAESEPMTPFLPPAPRSAAPVLGSQDNSSFPPVGAERLLAPPTNVAPPAARKELILCRYYHTPGMVCTSSPCRFVHNVPALQRASGAVHTIPSTASTTLQLQFGPGTASLTAGLTTPRASSPGAPGREDPTRGTFAAAQTAAPVPVPASLQLHDVDVALLTSGEAIAVRDQMGAETVGHVFTMSGGGKGPAGKSRLKFRTVPCRDYATGTCAYGVYCSFIHDPNNLYDEDKHGKKDKSGTSASGSGTDKSDSGITESKEKHGTEKPQTPKVEAQANPCKVEDNQERTDTEASSEEPSTPTPKLKKASSIDNLSLHKPSAFLGPAGLDEGPPTARPVSLLPPLVSGPERPKSTPAHMELSSHIPVPPAGNVDSDPHAVPSDLWDPARDRIPDPSTDDEVAATFSPIPAATFISMPVPQQAVPHSLTLPGSTQPALSLPLSSPSAIRPLIPCLTRSPRPTSGVASPTYSPHPNQNALAVSLSPSPIRPTAQLPSLSSKGNIWEPPTSQVDGAAWPVLSTVRSKDEHKKTTAKGKGTTTVPKSPPQSMKKGRVAIAPIGPPKKTVPNPFRSPKMASRGKTPTTTTIRAPAPPPVPVADLTKVEWPALASKTSLPSPKTPKSPPTQTVWKLSKSPESSVVSPTMTRTSTDSTTVGPTTPMLEQSLVQATQDVDNKGASPVSPTSTTFKEPVLPPGCIWKSDIVPTPQGLMIRNRPQASYHTKLCKYFAAGNCQYGDNCAFLHPAPGQEVPTSPGPTRLGASPRNDIVCAAYNEPNGCPLSEEECQFAHLTIVPDEPGRPIKRVRTRVCRHFQVGRCHMGDKCFFLHVMPTVDGSQHASAYASGAATPTQAGPGAQWLLPGASAAAPLMASVHEWETQTQATYGSSPPASEAGVSPNTTVAAIPMARSGPPFTSPQRPPFWHSQMRRASNDRHILGPPRVPRNTPDLPDNDPSARSSFSSVSQTSSPHSQHVDVPLSTPTSPKLLTPEVNMGATNGTGTSGTATNGHNTVSSRDGYFGEYSLASSPSDSIGGATSAEHCPDWAETGRCSKGPWCHLSHVGEGERNAAALTEAALAAACEQLRKAPPPTPYADSDDEDDDDDELEITTAAATTRTHSSQSSSVSSAIRISANGSAAREDDGYDPEASILGLGLVTM